MCVLYVYVFNWKWPGDKQLGLQLIGGHVYADDTVVLYHKFNITSSSSYRHAQHPTSDHKCVIDTVGHWRAARCAKQHLTVCQSDRNIVPGKKRFYVMRRSSVVFSKV